MTERRQTKEAVQKLSIELDKNKRSSTTKTIKITGPTFLTISRMVLAIFFVIFASLPHFWSRVVSLVIFLIAAISDQIDGYWARKKDIITDLGIFLDPLADKMLVNLAFLVLTVSGTIPLWAFAVILVRDFAVDGMRMTVSHSGVAVSASFLGKLKTIFQMTTLVVFLLNQIVNQEYLQTLANVALYVALILTVLSGLDYLIKGWEEIAR